MLLYAPSLGYPFVWYDSDDLLRAVKYSVAELFSGVAGYQYYRPLIFTIWKAILSAWGPASAPIIHASLIGLHALNGVLLYALARDLAHDRKIAATAALLFTAYPFSYQAVTWAIAHQPPPMLATLGCLVIYTRARLARRPTNRPDAGKATASHAGAHDWPTVTRHLAGMLCLVAATLLHETGFVVAAILVLIEGYLVAARRLPRLSGWPVAYMAVTLVMFAIYSSVAKSPPNEDTWQPITGLYLLQGLVYPAAMLLASVCALPGCDSAAWLLPVAGLTLLLVFVRWRLNRTVTIGVLGLLWYLVGAAPVWAGRDYAYVEYAPRLLYLAGAGASLAFAAILGAGPGRLGRILQGGLIAFVLLQSARFVIARQALHAEAFRLLEQENQAMFAPRRGTAVFVNTVELFTYKNPEFPLGWFGVLVSPWHNRLVETLHLRADPPADWVIDPAHAQETQTGSRLQVEFHGRTVPPEQFPGLLTGVSDVYRVGAMQDGELRLFQIGRIQRERDRTESALVEWSGAVRLLGASVKREAGVPVLSLDWSISGAVEPSCTVFVHVRNAAGQIVAQADGDPIGGMAPLGGWPPGDIIQERRPLLLPPDLSPGTYDVYIGLYNRTTLERLAPGRAMLPVADGALAAGSFSIP
jgi:hypothetical protein